MSKPFYLTTPLYYVNAKPHLGHAYTTIVADSLVRAHRQRGEDAFLLTGTDEHGEKIAQAAEKEKLSPKEFVDKIAQVFINLWKTFGISYDRFIRTTDEDHKATVQKICQSLFDKELLKPGTYTFWYCVPCETGWVAGDLKKVPGSRSGTFSYGCATCGRGVEEITEEDYFLHLEDYREWLKSHIDSHPEFIQPKGRRNEVLAMLEKPLPPLCVTRPKERVSWGVEVPFSPTHVTYVWFDALLNYISALGWPDDAKFKTYWEGAGAVHLIGKDILRHHALYWPIILRAAGIPPPKTVYAHGWWLIQGEKMSKSKGNIVEPEEMVKAYGLDAFRYFLLRDAPFGDDGIFSETSFIKRLNSDLANDLGNLVYRSLTMIEKHLSGVIPNQKPTEELLEKSAQAIQGVKEQIEGIRPDLALKSLWDLISWANQRIERKAPWTLAKEKKQEELESLLYELAEVIRVIALLVWPFLPTTAESIWKQLGFSSDLGQEGLGKGLKKPIPAGQKIDKSKPLFPRIEFEGHNT
jgi:methionyl-tRNA synthetase